MKEFLEKNNGKYPTKRTEKILNEWITYNKYNNIKDKLCQERFDLLDKLPNWKWLEDKDLE